MMKVMIDNLTVRNSKYDYENFTAIINVFFANKLNKNENRYVFYFQNLNSHCC